MQKYFKSTVSDTVYIKYANLIFQYTVGSNSDRFIMVINLLRSLNIIKILKLEGYHLEDIGMIHPGST